MAQIELLLSPVCGQAAQIGGDEEEFPFAVLTTFPEELREAFQQQEDYLKIFGF